jgi:hypothetical protein
MKIALRLVFVALIGLGLACQAWRLGRGGAEADTREALPMLLRQLGVQAEAAPEADMLRAHSPRCAQPFAVGQIAIDGAQEEIARQYAGPGIVVRYVYLGAVTPGFSRLALSARWALATLLFDVGLRADKPPHAVVVVATPENCPDLATIDWPTLSP